MAQMRTINALSAAASTDPGLQREVNEDGCDPVTKTQLADCVTTAIP